jgi:hypothetical protein
MRRARTVYNIAADLQNMSQLGDENTSALARARMGVRLGLEQVVIGRTHDHAE